MHKILDWLKMVFICYIFFIESTLNHESIRGRALKGQYTFSTPEQSVPHRVDCYLLAVTALLTVNAFKSVVKSRSESLLRERYMPLMHTSGLAIVTSKDINVDVFYVAKQHSKYLKCCEQTHSLKVTLPKIRL